MMYHPPTKTRYVTPMFVNANKYLFQLVRDGQSRVVFPESTGFPSFFRDNHSRKDVFACISLKDYESCAAIRSILERNRMIEGYIDEFFSGRFDTCYVRSPPC